MASENEEETVNEPTTEQPPPTPERRRRALWPGLVILGAALLGLAIGLGLVVRGRSLNAGAPAAAVIRPTFVIVASVSPSPIRSPSPVVGGSPGTATEYVVQPGDTLRSIASNVYGDADQWPRIYDANRDAIGSDPDALQAGMRLLIP